MMGFLKVFVVLVVVFGVLGQTYGSGHDIHRLVPYADDYDWSAAEAVLTDAIEKHAFPGCVAVVGNKDGYLFAKAFGNYTYGVPPPLNSNNPPMTLDTLFDLASLSKVVGATNAIAQFYQRGELALDTPVGKILGPEYNTNGKEYITVLNCLLHNAGYPADPYPGYYEPVFGCPGSSNYTPPESFDCQAKIYNALLNQTLQYPTGSEYIYSDLSYITLMYVVGTLAQELNYVTVDDLVPGCYNNGGPGSTQCFFEAYVRKYVFEALQLNNTGFLPPSDVWSQCAPTTNDTGFRNVVVQGQVEDPNAYIMGGISGHAGVFSTVGDIFTLGHRIMFASPNDTFLNATTTALFTREYNHSQSSRALGWNTNDPSVFDYGWNLTCGSLSPYTWMHLGWTGTEICGDPVREIITLLFTNRVYPNPNDEPGIMSARQDFNTAVQQIYDNGPTNSKARNAGGVQARTLSELN